MRRIPQLLLATLAILSAAAQAPAADFILFGTDDGLKIPRQFVGSIPHASHGHVWTLADTTLRLAGAREEWLSCQVAIHAQRNLVGVDVTVSDLLFNGHRIPADSVTLYREMEIRAASVGYSATYPGMLPPGFYRDPLLPFEDPYPSGAGALGAPFDVSSSLNAAIWLDIHLPRGIPAGTYRGTITVTENTLALPRNVFLEVTVLDFTIPRTTDLPMVVGLFPNQLATAEGVSIANGGLNPDYVAMLRRYERMAQDHRFQLDHRAMVPSRTFDPVTGALLATDWTAYDEYLGPVIEGTVFPDASPPPLWLLPFEPEFLAYPFTGAAEALSVTQYAAEIVSHFQAKGWPLESCYAWIYDEPSIDGLADTLSPGEIAEITAYYAALKAGSPLVNVLVSEGIEDSVLVAATDWLGCKGDKYYPPEMQGFQAAGRKTFFYQSYLEPSLGIESINTHAVAMRTWPWIAWKYDVSGHFYWAGNFWNTAAPYDTADGQPLVYNDGNGTLYYPGGMLHTKGIADIDGPLSSVRMKNLRRGRQDFAYLELLRERGFEAFADSVVNALVVSGLCVDYSPTGAYRGGRSHYQGAFNDPRHVGGLRNGQWPDSASNWYLARQGMGDFLATLGDDSLMAWVIEPNEPDTLDLGGVVTLRWEASGAGPGATADLFLSTDGGVTFADTLALGEPNDGAFDWAVHAVPGGLARLVVRVCDGGDCVSDASDVPFGLFDLSAPLVSTGRPGPGDAWEVGLADTVLWTATDNDIVAGLEIALSLDAGATFPVTLESGGANDGELVFTVPRLFSDSALVRVTATDAAGNVGVAITPGVFQVDDTVAPLGTLLAPEAGRMWRAARPETLRWSVTDADTVTGVDLVLARGAGAGGTVPIALAQGAAGEFVWLAPESLVTDSARIVLTAADAADNLLELAAPDGFFRILPSPETLTLTMAVLHNPVLTRYLDIFVVAWASVADTTLALVVEGDTLALVPTDPEAHVYRAQYVLPASGNLDIRVCGRDAADALMACDERTATVELARPGTGAMLLDPEAQWSVRVFPASLTKSMHLTVVEEAPGRLPAGALAALEIGPPGLTFAAPTELRIQPASFGVPGLEARDIVLMAEGPLGEEPLPVTEDPLTGEVVAGLHRTARVTVALGSSAVPAADPLPAAHRLEAGEPNPTSGAARLRFALPGPEAVDLAVYDVAGRRIRTLDAGRRAAGTHAVSWDGRDEEARPVPSGVYFVRLQTAARVLTQKLVLVR